MGKSIRNLSTVTRVGLDLAKRVFQVHAVEAKGEIVVGRKLTRSQPDATAPHSTLRIPVAPPRATAPRAHLERSRGDSWRGLSGCGLARRLDHQDSATRCAALQLILPTQGLRLSYDIRHKAH
jgi:hypothetical protein